MKPFERWKYEEVELTFGTERVKTLPALAHWLEADEPADDYETKTLNRYYDQLVRKVEAWNEDELKFFFSQTSSHLLIFLNQKFIPHLLKELSPQNAQIFMVQM